jgi:hypothetical protein
LFLKIGGKKKKEETRKKMEEKKRSPVRPIYRPKSPIQPTGVHLPLLSLSSCTARWRLLHVAMEIDGTAVTISSQLLSSPPARLQP